jgi:hypothetical protein
MVSTGILSERGFSPLADSPPKTPENRADAIENAIRLGIILLFARSGADNLP